MDLLNYRIGIYASIQQDTKHGQYNDTIYLPIKDDKLLQSLRDEFDEFISKEGMTRVENWINIVENPTPYVEPSKEIYQQLISSRQEEIAKYEEKIEYTKEELQAKEAELQTKLSEISDSIEAKK